MSRALAGLLYRWRFLLTGLLGAGALLLAPLADITHIDNDMTAWFSKEDQVYRDYERFREEFAGTRSLIIALKADSADRLFSPAALAFIERISGDIERVDTVERVDSLATATIVEAAGDGLEVRRLIDLARTRGPDALRRRALQDDLIRGDLVSEDGTVTALVVSFDEDRIDAVRAGVIETIHGIVDPALPQGVRAYYNGSLEITETYNRVTLANQRRFTPPILLFTVLAIYATFRSIRKTAITLVAVGVSVLWTLGLYSLLGFSYNILSSMIVPLIVVLAIADDVHIMQRWDEERRHGSAERAFRNTVAHLAAPLLGASATTALGMLSLATSDVVAVRSFGIGAAIGIMVDFVISLTVMPTLLSLVKPETAEAPHERYLLPPLQRVAGWSTRHPGRVFTACVLVAAVAALGILKLRVETNHITFFSDGHPLSESAAVIDSQLAGVYSFQIMLEGPPDSLKTPDALMRIDSLQEELRRAPYVRKVTSIADYVKRIHRELNDGRPEAHVIPQDAATIAQELFVFTLGGDGRHELERIAASDFSRAQIAVKLQSMSSDLVLQQVESADRLAKELFAGTGIEVLTTGSGRLFSMLDRYLVDSQVSSFGTAFITVFSVIFIVFRSARFGLLSIIPNLLPVISVLGVMGYLGISLNIATVMVASVALGVVDDDTIHFINRYRREVAAGARTDEAIFSATSHEGRASLTTAIINSCGYAVLLLSEYKPTAWFGGLLALTMGVAFLAEVLILPATIKLLPRFFGADALRRGRALGVAAAGMILIALLPSPSAAQPVPAPTGSASVLTAWFPGRQDATELRLRGFAEGRFEPAPSVRLVVSGFVEAIAARRPEPQGQPAAASDAVAVRDAALRLHDAYVEFRGARVDLVVGSARVVWGRLDEIQPTDVVNPLDVSRFFLDGRAEARLPVPLIRARLFVSDRLSLEGVYVPVYRRGRFDMLDEASSPFAPRLLPEGLPICAGPGCPALPPVVLDDEPAVRWSNGQGGARVSGTAGRVDWSVSGYRGIEAFPLYAVAAGARADAPRLEAVYSRYSVIGADFETVVGPWGFRGEAAGFVDDRFQRPGAGIVGGSSLDAGLGVDRRTGEYRVGASVLFHREVYDRPAPAVGAGSRSDVSLVLSADRSFARERYRIRAFGVTNPAQRSGFTRAIATADLRDNLALEASAGLFLGRGEDPIGRFADNDFTYLRLQYYF